MSAGVLFDLYNTLLSGADDQRDQVVAEMADVLDVEPAALIRAYHESWPQRQTQWGPEETVRLLAGRIGATPSDDQVARALALRHALATRILAAPPPSTVAVLHVLRADGRRLGLVSNATSDTARAWPGSPLAGLFEVAVFSCDVGAAKPDPTIYLAAADALGTTPSGCVFVGDGADDELAGAAALGMRVVRTTEHHNRDPSWTGPTIASLAELPDLVSLSTKDD